MILHMLSLATWVEPQVGVSVSAKLGEKIPALLEVTSGRNKAQHIVTGSKAAPCPRPMLVAVAYIGRFIETGPEFIQRDT
jgi:hypothetical protein